jgi:hypothetical protein
VKYVYVDMDGVLTDFDKRYVELFREDPKQTRDKKNGNKGQYSINWKEFVNGKNFSSLEWTPRGQVIVNTIKHYEEQYKIEVKILTSSGGTDKHNEVAKQKLNWVSSNGIEWPTIVVPGRRYKKLFANKDSFIIDDTPDVIEGFVQNGGHGVIHDDKSYDYTFFRLEEFLDGQKT